jgi:hypothetical protein
MLFTKHNQKSKVKGGIMGRACSMNREKRNACTVLEEKPKKKRPLGRPRC